MFYASAYPNSDLSAGALAAIAVVMTAVLAFWLIMVFLAAREPRKRPATPVAAAPDDVTEDEHRRTVLTG